MPTETKPILDAPIMHSSKQFWETIRKHVKPGSRVAELYHGAKDDILRGLAETAEIVYGVDARSAGIVDRYPHMKDLQNVPNIKLIHAFLPPLDKELQMPNKTPFPEELVDLDAIIIREFRWTYPLWDLIHHYVKNYPEFDPFDPDEVDIYQAIDMAIKPKGHLVLSLNEIEQQMELSENSKYQKTIRSHLPAFRKIHHKDDLMIFEKG